MKSGKDSAKEKYDPGRRKFLKGVGLASATAAVADKLWTSPAETAPAEGSKEPVLAGTVAVTLNINGQNKTVSVEPRTTLLNTLRNHIDPPVTGPKLVCDMGSCGACTVMLECPYSCLVSLPRLPKDIDCRRLPPAADLSSDCFCRS
jgi:xanthine dehydrogenase YagT iron-sulfur-binding subunit